MSGGDAQTGDATVIAFAFHIVVVDDFLDDFFLPALLQPSGIKSLCKPAQPSLRGCLVPTRPTPHFNWASIVIQIDVIKGSLGKSQQCRSSSSFGVVVKKNCQAALPHARAAAAVAAASAAAVVAPAVAIVGALVFVNQMLSLLLLLASARRLHFFVIFKSHKINELVSDLVSWLSCLLARKRLKPLCRVKQKG